MIKLLQGLQVDVASSFATSFLSTPPPPSPTHPGKDADECCICSLRAVCYFSAGSRGRPYKTLATFTLQALGGE